jgi:hypothetical protein
MGIESILACNLQILQWLSESSEIENGDSKRHRETRFLQPSTRSVCRASGFVQVGLPDKSGLVPRCLVLAIFTEPFVGDNFPSPGNPDIIA